MFCFHLRQQSGMKTTSITAREANRELQAKRRSPSLANYCLSSSGVSKAGGWIIGCGRVTHLTTGSAEHYDPYHSACFLVHECHVALSG